MRVLVVAASKYGATDEIADVIGRVLTDRGLMTTVKKPSEVDSIDVYDAVVLGSAVYSGHWMQPAKELVGRFRTTLSERPVWLFSSGPIGDPPKPQEDPIDVSDIAEVTHARDHHVFAGRLSKDKLNPGDRAIARAFGAADGDFRDWDEIQRWTSQIADALSDVQQ